MIWIVLSQQTGQDARCDHLNLDEHDVRLIHANKQKSD